MGSPCTLLLLASSSVSSSGLESFSAVLGGAWREPFLHDSLPTSFFVLSTVCFLPPDLMCVSFLVAVLTSVSVLFVSLTAETVSQEGHPKQRSQALQGEIRGRWEPVRIVLLRQFLEIVLCHPHHTVFKKKVITSENLGYTEIIP